MPIPFPSAPPDSEPCGAPIPSRRLHDTKRPVSGDHNSASVSCVKVPPCTRGENPCAGAPDREAAPLCARAAAQYVRGGHRRLRRGISGMSYKVAVVGATGNVGREMLSVLAERQFPGAGGGGAGLHPLGRHRRVVRRFDAQGEGARLFRFRRHRHLPDVGGRGGVEGMVAKDRRRGCHRDRQLLAMAHGPRGPPDRARSERGRAGWGHKEGHRRQPQLLDSAAGRGAETAARRGHHQAGDRINLPVGVRRRQGGDGRTFRPDAGGVRGRSHRAQDLSRPHRIQRNSARRHVSRFGLHHRGMEDHGRDAEDSRSGHPGHGHLRARAGVHLAFRGGERRIRAPDHGPAARGRSCAKRRASSSSTSARTAATSRRSMPLAKTPPMSAASARTPRSTTGSPCGWSPTISERAPHSTRCRLRRS